MFWCYICGDGLETFAEFRKHINKHAKEHELLRPIRCCQGSCRNTFDKTFNLFRHSKTFHKGDEVSTLPAQISTHTVNGAQSPMCPSVDAESDTDMGDIDTVNARLDSMRTESELLVASLRANSSIPYSVLPPIIESVNTLSANLVDVCRTEAVNCLSRLTVNNCNGAELLKNFEIELRDKFEHFKAPLDFLETKYK